MEQKGSALLLIILGVVIILGAIGGIYYFGKLQSVKPEAAPSPNPVVTSQTPQPTPTPQPTSIPDTTTNWKVFQFTDSTGFGYAIKAPPDWNSRPFGGEANPEPKEIAQNIYKNCGGVKDDNVQILHFNDNNPQPTVNSNYNSLEKDGFTKSTINTQSGLVLNELTGEPVKIGLTDHYIYIITPKGYYSIFGRGECTSNFSTLFNQILSTFKFTDQTQTSNLPKDKCPCWDSVRNTCLPQSSCI